MANSQQATKRARQAEKRREHNTSQKSAARTSIKKVLHAAMEKQVDGAKEALRTAFSAVDRLAKRKLIHANKASRIKKQLAKTAKTAG